MALIGSSNEEQIWNYLKNAIGNEYSTAALMGNLYAISCLNPKWVGLDYRKKNHFDNDKYFKMIDGGVCYQFVRDDVPFGIAQWKFWTKKRELQNFADNKHKTLSDLETQLEFLVYELQKYYPTVWQDLLSANSILEASNSIIFNYENNPSQNDKNFQKQRENYGLTFFNKYSDIAEKELINKQIDFVNYLAKSHYSQYIFSEDIHYISNTGETDKMEDNAIFKPVPWYNGGWTHILRHPNNFIKLSLADVGILTNITGLVDYSISKDNYFNILAKAGYRPNNIKKKCATNCCHMIVANTRAIGYLTNRTRFKDLKADTVSEMSKAYQTLGFEIINDPRQLVYPDFLLPGDILINEKNRATINITLGQKYKNQIKEALL